MKKLLLITAFIASAFSVNAQKISSFADFTSDLEYKVVFGGISVYGMNCDFKEVETSSFAFVNNFGVDAVKPIKYFVNDRLNVYGLAGLHYAKKGGWTEIWNPHEISGGGRLHYLSVPVRAGASFRLFGKCKFLLDFGPYFAFRIGGSLTDIYKLHSTELGLGGSIGFQFGAFGLGFSGERGLTPLAEYENYKLTSLGCSIVTLSWSF